MVRAGMYKVFVGIETTDSAVLELAGKRQNTRVDADAACKKISHTGLQIVAGIILGLDGERPGTGRILSFCESGCVPRKSGRSNVRFEANQIGQE